MVYAAKYDTGRYGDSYYDYVPGEIRSDYYIGKIETRTLSSDYHIKNSYSETISSDYNLWATKWDIKSDYYISKEYSETITQDAFVVIEYSVTIDQNAYIKGTPVQTISSDYYIVGTATVTINSNYNIKVEGAEGSIVSDYNIFRTISETINSDYYIFKEGQNSLTSNYHILKTYEGSINSDANIIYTYQNSLTSDYFIVNTYTNSLSSDYELLRIRAPTLVSPPDGSQVTVLPLVFVWDTPLNADFLNRNIHCEIQISADSGFSSIIADYMSTMGLANAVFEYYDGANWQPFPAAGLPQALYGSRCRVTITTIQGGTKYWRARLLVLG
jgi:hypothetical protein